MPEPTPLILARREATDALGECHRAAASIVAGTELEPALAVLLSATAIASELRALGFAIEQAANTPRTVYSVQP